MNLIGICQQHVFRTVPIALPSPECYRIAEDKNGFMWIATEQGLCRYDGQKTLVFNSKNGLKEKAIYALRKDSNGVLWALSKSGELLQIEHSKIIKTGIRKINPLSSFGGFGYDLFFLNEQIVIPIEYSNAKTYSKKNNKTSLFSSKLSNECSILVVDEGNVIPYSISRYSIKKSSNRIICFIDKQHPFRNQIVKLPSQPIVSSQIISCTHNGYSFFSEANNLVIIDADGKKRIHSFPHRILSLFPDKHGGIWVGVLGFGLYYYKKGDFSSVPVRSLHGLSVSNITEDHEGHIWCTTLEKGVYRCLQPGITTYNNFSGLQRKLDYLSTINVSFIASVRFNEIVTIDKERHTNRIELKNNFAEVITGVIISGKNWFIGCKEGLFSGLLKNNSIYLKRYKDFQIVNCIQFMKHNGNFYGLGYRKIYCFRNGEIVPITNQFEDRPRCFLPINSNRFMVAMYGGVQFIERINGSEKVTKIPHAPRGINKLFYAKKSNRIFALTKGKGLFEFKKNRFVSCNQSLQISIDVLNDGLEDKYGNIWIATNEGLIKCTWSGKELRKAKVLNELHGLPSKVCDKLAVNENEIAVSTTEGLVILSINRINESTVPPLVFLQNVLVDGKKIELHHAKLNHEQNTINFNVSVLTYHQSGGQSLKYVLEHNGVIETGKSTVNLLLQNLEPGDYKLKIYGCNIFGISSLKPLYFEFQIRPPFWATWFFIIAMILVLLAIIYTLIIWIQKRTERRAEKANHLKMQLAKSQLSALQAQMNPHFLFNSICSIQNFIMSNKREEAYDYLTSFSKLIRNTLNNSRSQFISLAKEVETIQLYMKLEQRRYNNKFDFHLEISPDIKPELILLPASLIQPLLENAVWHGVMTITNERRGEIMLEILKEDEFLGIIVTDNGGGLKETSSNHQSLAISIIEEQLALVSVGTDEKSIPKVEIKSASSGFGTIVTFKIPILKKV